LSERSDINRLVDMRAALADIQNLTNVGKEALRADRVANRPSLTT